MDTVLDKVACFWLTVDGKKNSRENVYPIHPPSVWTSLYLNCSEFYLRLNIMYHVTVLCCMELRC
jgi:hypothetical protein